MNSLITSKYGHKYIYSQKQQMFIYIPKQLEKLFTQFGDNSNDYYYRKYLFLLKNHYLEDIKTEFQPNYEAEKIKYNLANLRQLLIEVTDSCNLKCRYCGYGEFYSNYDKRETCSQTFANVKVLLDYLISFWCSDYNTSFNNTVVIGFYGGEPLLNMALIKETIDYVSRLDISTLKFSYNMTTNGVLLDKYMDLLAENQFDLLLSLDGNEFNSSYRVDKGGHGSFTKIVSNIHKLKEKYPVYFEEHVNFNSVLHDRNSVDSCLYYIKETFGKIPRIAELSVNDIVEEKRESFMKMFKNRIDDYKKKDHKGIESKYGLGSPIAIEYHSMIMNYCGNRYDTYSDLFKNTSTKYIPTGTCRPFERKLFLTVHGKILPCEKVGQGRVLAYIKDGKLDLDIKKVAEFYSIMYDQVIGNCRYCLLNRACSQCMFLLKEKGGKLYCPGLLSSKMLLKRFSDFLSYAEDNPSAYEMLMSEITID